MQTRRVASITLFVQNTSSLGLRGLWRCCAGVEYELRKGVEMYLSGNILVYEYALCHDEELAFFVQGSWGTYMYKERG